MNLISNLRVAIYLCSLTFLKQIGQCFAWSSLREQVASVAILFYFFYYKHWRRSIATLMRSAHRCKYFMISIGLLSISDLSLKRFTDVRSLHLFFIPFYKKMYYLNNIIFLTYICVARYFTFFYAFYIIMVSIYIHESI